MTRLVVTKWMPAIAWMLLIFAGSSDVLSAQQTSKFLVPFLLWLDPAMSYHTIAAIHMMVRKLGHLTEYAILATLLWRALHGTFTAIPRRFLAVVTFLIAAAFAASDEFHQSFIPSRTATVHDVFIDCVGAMFAIALCVMLSRTAVASASGR
jgi:VanZ family protein